MNFDNNKPIYLQVAELISDRVVSGVYSERIAGIRELAAELQLNPNTVQRGCEYLQQNGVLQAERGVGLLIQNDAIRKIKQMRKAAFLEAELPRLAQTMDILEISEEEISAILRKYRKNR